MSTVTISCRALGQMRAGGHLQAHECGVNFEHRLHISWIKIVSGHTAIPSAGFAANQPRVLNGSTKNANSDPAFEHQLRGE